MRDPDKLPKVPRRMKQISRKFIHDRRLTRRERRRLIRWINACHRAIGAPPLRQHDGRIFLLDL